MELLLIKEDLCSQVCADIPLDAAIQSKLGLLAKDLHSKGKNSKRDYLKKSSLTSTEKLAFVKRLVCGLELALQCLETDL